MENGKKVDIFYLVVLILALITLMIGVTFTIFTLAGKEDDDSTQIRTGTLSINYIDGREINTYDLFPIDEPGFNDEMFVYKKNFTVTSDGTLDQTIDIYIDNIKNEFVDNHLMYNIYDENNNKIGSGGFNSENKILIASNLYLKSGESKSYSVHIWLKETGDNQDNEQNCSFNGSFDIEAQQIKYE